MATALTGRTGHSKRVEKSAVHKSRSVTVPLKLVAEAVGYRHFIIPIYFNIFHMFIHIFHIESYVSSPQPPFFIIFSTTELRRISQEIQQGNRWAQLAALGAALAGSAIVA